MADMEIDWDDRDAARYLSAGLAALARVEQEKTKYDYEIPYSVHEDEERAVRLIKSAVRSLTRSDSGDDDAP